jgi:hypothetical protein
VIHHKEDEPGFVICPNELATGIAGLKDIFGYWFVKVYIVHIPRIPRFERFVKISGNKNDPS